MKKIAFAIAMIMAPLFACMAQDTTQAQSATAQAAQDDDAKYATDLLKQGTEAPDFTLSTPDGKTVTLSSLRGHYVVLDFWASWCPDCRKDLPAIVALHKTYGTRGVEFVGVSFDDKKENLDKAIAQYGIEYAQVSELKKWKETKISALYNIKWIPTMYLIAPDGKVALATVMSDKLAAKLAEIMPDCDEKQDCCNDNKPAACCKDSKPAACCKDSKPATCCKDSKPATCCNDNKPATCCNDNKPAACCKDSKPASCTNKPAACCGKKK